jgi:hypothetical protein
VPRSLFGNLGSGETESGKSLSHAFGQEMARDGNCELHAADARRDDRYLVIRRPDPVRMKYSVVTKGLQRQVRTIFTALLSILAICSVFQRRLMRASTRL